jgi:hypothetical protein
MEIVEKDFKSPIYVDTSHQIRIRNTHHYGELFLLIKCGVGIPTTSYLDERKHDEIVWVKEL